MPRARISKQPSVYPPLAFHLLRMTQLLSSAIVLSILSFFIHNLHIEHFYVPWTFLLLFGVSILTIVSLVFTSLLHSTRALPPKLNFPFNGLNATLWALGFALLTWNISPTLGHRCTPETWNHDAGIMICRLYKALTAFTITGLVSTFLALFLDLRTHRNATHRGIYNPMADFKGPLIGQSKARSQAAADASSTEQDPYHDRAAVAHGLSRPYKVQRPIQAQQFGYSAPSEQTTYDSGVWGQRV